MRNTSVFYKFLLSIFLLFSQMAIAHAKVSEGDIYRYLELSGIKPAIEGIPAQVQAMSQQMQLTSKDPVKDQQVLSAIVDSWQEDKIFKAIVGNIQASFTEAEMSELLNWLESDLAKKIKLEELQTSQPEFAQELMRYMADLQSNPPTPERQQLVRQYVDNTKMVENGVELAVAIVENMFKSFASVSPDFQMSESQMQQQLGNMRNMMSQMMSQQMIMTAYYTYRDISDADLAKYAEFYQKALGQKELTVVYGGLINGMKSWGEDIATAIAQAVKNK